MQDAGTFPRIIVQLDELRRENSDASDYCINEPLLAIEMLEIIVKEILKERFATHVTERLLNSVRVTFNGSLAKHTFTPRGLKAGVVNKLVKVQGIVVSTSKVRPRLLESTHFNESHNTFHTYGYNDDLGLRIDSGADKEFAKDQVPLYDQENNPLSLEFGLCKYKDVQLIVMQETPESVPTGMLSRSVEIVVQEEMVDIAKPGDRLSIIGIYRPLEIGSSKHSAMFRSALLAMSLEVMNPVDGSMLNPRELKDITKISKRQDLLDLLIRSIAPSICGHLHVKEAMLILLLGGCEKMLGKGIRLRGDINVLLVGDPSVGKSQFLRRIMTLAPLVFNTTGRGSTGVGLTAAVTMDKDTGEKHLEAGAMVLADRGIICVDEFDKMSVEDRVAMHEVMEQQTVTIAKAGIHVSLNARCSVLAAANPVYGEYVTSRSASSNINLPDSLLSRFDLVFIVLDDREDSEKDRKIATRVTNNHRFGGGNILGGMINDGSGLIEEEVNSGVGQTVRTFQQYNKFVHEDKNKDYLSLEFLKKYIHHAKTRTPKLTDQSSALISKLWTRIREYDNRSGIQERNRIQPVTIRSLESLIRLSTAYAKMRLSHLVEEKDVVRGVQIFLQSFYGGEKNLELDIFEGLVNQKKNLGSVKKLKEEEVISSKIEELSLKKRDLKSQSNVKGRPSDQGLPSQQLGFTLSENAKAFNFLLSEKRTQIFKNEHFFTFSDLIAFLKGSQKLPDRVTFLKRLPEADITRAVDELVDKGKIVKDDEGNFYLC